MDTPTGHLCLISSGLTYPKCTHLSQGSCLLSYLEDELPLQSSTFHMFRVYKHPGMFSFGNYTAAASSSEFQSNFHLISISEQHRKSTSCLVPWHFTTGILFFCGILKGKKKQILFHAFILEQKFGICDLRGKAGVS